VWTPIKAYVCSIAPTALSKSHREAASKRVYPYPELADGLAGRPRHEAGNREVSRKVRAPQDKVVGNAHPG